ncbi:MAG: hypothetical protein Q7S31_03265 [bacterium]|nr:hypothetical protein [bacterium]
MPETENPTGAIEIVDQPHVDGDEYLWPPVMVGGQIALISDLAKAEDSSGK